MLVTFVRVVGRFQNQNSNNFFTGKKSYLLRNYSIMKKFFPVFLLGSTFTILSCNNAGTANNASEESSTKMSKESVFDLDKARTTITDETAKFSDEFKRSDSIALAAHYASDGMIMPPNSEAVKKDGLVSLWGNFIRSGIKELKLSVQDVAGNDDMLTETGTYELVGDNNKSLDKGKYVVVWKNENGSWKIFRDIFNTNLPATTK
jgi:ketosteroid isomerase-like protein